MKQSISNKAPAAAWWAAPLLAATLPAQAALVAESLDAVTGVTETTPRTVADVLAANPEQLANGSQWVSVLDTNPANVNVRSAGNAVNTGGFAAGSTQGFGGFFGGAGSTNQYLVLGDQSGAIGGDPTGGLIGNLAGFAVPFTVEAGTSSLSVSFDWAFNGQDNSTSTVQQDRFLVGLAGGTLSWTSLSVSSSLLLNKASPSDFAAGHFNQIVSGIVPGDYWLAFALTEAGGSLTNTAAGIDNITVSAVPLPAALWLLLGGLAQLPLLAKRRRSRRMLAA